MEWLDVPRKANPRGRLAIISGFVILYFIFRFSGHGLLLGPLFGLAAFYWLGKTFAKWYMSRKFAKRRLANVMAWACCVGLFSLLAGAFAVGASYEFNRFRKDIPRKFVLLPTTGLIVTILSTIAVIYAKQGRL